MRILDGSTDYHIPHIHYLPRMTAQPLNVVDAASALDQLSNHVQRGSFFRNVASRLPSQFSPSQLLDIHRSRFWLESARRLMSQSSLFEHIYTTTVPLSGTGYT